MNKGGWGIKAMIGFSCLFFLCLIIATVLSVSLGLNKEQKIVEEFNGKNVEYSSDYNYEDLEEKLQNSARTYISMEHENKISYSPYKITSKTLIKDGYLDSLYDNEDKDCTGYVLVTNAEEDLDYEAYIKCPKYETSGY